MDMARAIATFAVIVIHVSAVPLIDAQGSGHTSLLYLMINLGARFAVPTFVLLSGMGLTLSHRVGESYWTYLKRRLNKIVPLYVVWSVVYSLFYDDYLGQLVTPGHKSVWSVVADIFTGNGCYHLYFVPMIVLFYISFPVLHKALRNRAGFVLLSVFSIAIIFADRYSLLPKEIRFLADYRDPMRWMVYFAAGVWLAGNCYRLTVKKSTAKVLLWVGMLAYASWMCAAAYPLAKTCSDVDIAIDSVAPMLLIYVFIFIAWVWNQNWGRNRLTQSLSIISKHSYGIYLSHALVLAVVYPVDDWFSGHGMLNFYGLFVSLVTLIGALILSRLVATAEMSFVRMRS